MPAQLFISYRRSRQAEVLAAKAALAQAGVGVWLDQADIDPLADFPARIRAGIAASHAMLVWWSADYADSDICLQELRLAWQHARRHSSDVARRVWVLNPEPGGQHIFAGELNASNFLTPPAPGREAAWADALKRRLDDLLPEGPLADERQPEPQPPLYGVPTPSAEFTGRGAELTRIHSALFPARIGAGASGVAVQTHGLGGIGKTELAAKYARDFAHAYPAGILWLNLAPWQPARPATEADAQAAWLRALDASLAHAPDLWRQLALDPEGKARPAPEVRERLARHLGDQQPCLMVLDNLPELSPLDARRAILDFLAAPDPQGKTLVTTRDARPVEGENWKALGLEVLGPDDALRLLARYRPARVPAEREAMAAIVAEVGAHTQALVLLGERYREDPGGYPRALAALREQGQLPRIEAIAAQLADELGAKARGIAATFAISIEPLPEAARHLLALASVCAPNTPIPDGLLLLAYDGEPREDDFAQALRTLLRASLLDRRDHNTLRIHPLVAQSTLALLQPDEAALRNALARGCLERLEVLQSNISQARTLSADAALARHLAPRFANQTGVRLYLRLGQYEKGLGQLGNCRAAEEIALALATEVLGESHRDTLTAMNNLACTLQTLGDLVGAQVLHERELAVSRCEQGDDDPETLISMGNLASVLQARGNLPGARALLEKVVEAHRRILGEGDPNTLMSMANLASALYAQGELASARALNEKTLILRRRVLDKDHPDTLTTMDNLACTLFAQGDFAGARMLQEETLEANSGLADEHPATLTRMNNLANTLLTQGDLAGARNIQQQALDACRNKLGVENQKTTVFAWNLIAILDRIGLTHAVQTVLTNDLQWLVERDPDALSADQRRIRSYVRQIFSLDPDAAPSH
jgi:TIR domain-containing protein/tetratricopeptide repeat protein